MNRIFQTIFASVVASCVSTPVALGAAPLTEHTALHKEHHDHSEKMVGAQTAHELAKDCEIRLNKIKEISSVAASLVPDLKAEFEYNLEKAALEIKYLQNPSIKDFRKHANSCQRNVGEADHIIKKHEHQLVREKKMEERKAKVEHRKARAEERKAKALERKAKREAMKSHKASEHHHVKKHDTNAPHPDHHHVKKHDTNVPHPDHHHVKKHDTNAPHQGPDNGRLDGISTTPPGSEAAKPLSDEKK